MAAGRKTGGRKKGTPNKSTAAVKDAIGFAFEENGGAERLRDWINEDPKNEAAFLTQIWVKLLPLQVGQDPDSAPVTLNVNFNR